MRVLEEHGDGKNIGASVHHDEEEHARGKHSGKLRVVLDRDT